MRKTIFLMTITLMCFTVEMEAAERLWVGEQGSEIRLEMSEQGAGIVKVHDNIVTIRPDRGQAKVIQLEVIIPFGPEMQWSDEKPTELINLYVYAGQNGEFQLYEDEGTNYNYEKGKYATIDISYNDAMKTITFGARKGQFAGMLKNRRFNVVLITKDNPKPLDLENPEGKMVKYNGKAISIQL